MFTTRYLNELPGTYSKVMPTPLADPYWVCWNEKLADAVKLPLRADDELLSVFSGRGLISGHEPIAQKYAGHQFGGWNPELGDGRGLLLGEWQLAPDEVWEMHLKGAGKTPYSRFGDGRAVLRSTIREFIGSEALTGLGVPSTRALGVIGSSERVYRETAETGAALIRMTHSHVRFGHFEWFAHSGQHEQLKRLADYVIRHHFQQCQAAQDPIACLFKQVIQRTATMIAYWQAYGFVHGVMNTDNMSILGETFDYGPYAFLDNTQLKAVFNHTDERGRYAFDQQPSVGLWNLQRLGQALSPLTDARKLAECLPAYEDHYHSEYVRIMSLRLGAHPDKLIPTELIYDWHALLSAEQKDFHVWIRQLSALPISQWQNLADDFADRARFTGWCSRMETAVNADDNQRMGHMLAHNPATVARTHHLQSVIDAAQNQDFQPIESLLAALQSPFEEKPEWRQWHEPPEQSMVAGQLSCSS